MPLCTNGNIIGWLMVELMVDWLKVPWNWYPTVSHSSHSTLTFGLFHAHVSVKKITKAYTNLGCLGYSSLSLFPYNIQV